METIQSAFKRMSGWEDWKEGENKKDWKVNKKLFTDQLLAPTSEEVKTRKDCVKQLIKIDSKTEPNHVVYKFQMEILGLLATPTMKVFDLIRLVKSKDLKEIYHNNWIGKDAVMSLLPFGSMYHYGWDSESYNHEKMNAILNNDTTVYKHGNMRMVWDNQNGMRLIEDETLTPNDFKIINSTSLRYFFVNSSLETRFGSAVLQEGETVLEELGAGYVQITSSGNYGHFAKFTNDPKMDNYGNFEEIATNYNIHYSKNCEVGPGYVSKKYPWEAGTFYWKVLTFPEYQITSIGTYDRVVNERETLDEMIKNGHDLRYVTNFCFRSSKVPDLEYPGDDYYGKMALNLFVEGLFC